MLNGHTGCVNRVAWNADGSALATVSDDTSAVIWRWGEPAGSGVAKWRGTGREASGTIGGAPGAWGMYPAACIHTGHARNIFGVAWLAGRGDAALVTGGLDGQVRLHTASEAAAARATQAAGLSRGTTAGRLVPGGSEREAGFPAASGWTSTCVRQQRSYIGNVVAAPDDGTLFWSASNDGVVVQYDTRVLGKRGGASSGGSGDIIIRAALPTARSAAWRASNAARQPLQYAVMNALADEPPCISFSSAAVSPTNSHHLLLASCDAFLRLYDRRMLPSLAGPDVTLRALHRNVLCFTPLPTMQVTRATTPPVAYRRATYAEFDAAGTAILGNYSGWGTYVFNALASDADGPVRAFRTPPAPHPTAWDGGGRWTSVTAGDAAGRCWVSPPATARSRRPAPSFSAPPVTTLAKAAAAAAATSHKVNKLRGVPLFLQPLPRGLPAAVRTVGNAVFRARGFVSAEAAYCIALAAARWLAATGVHVPSSEVALAYLNRAAAYLQRHAGGDGAAVIADCYAALKADPSVGHKARYRLVRGLLAAGLAHKALMHASAMVKEAGGEPGAPPPATPGYAESVAARDDAKAGVARALAAEGRAGDASLLAEHPRPAHYPDDLVPAAYRQQGAVRQEEATPTEMEADEFLCTRHTGYYGGHCVAATTLIEAAFWPACVGIPLRAALQRLAVATGDAVPDVAGDRLAVMGDLFRGGRDGYIVAGSDTGDVMVYDRETAAVVAVLRGAFDTVNCVRPHPSLPVLATAGIQTCVRLWAPALPPHSPPSHDTAVLLPRNPHTVAVDSVANSMRLSRFYVEGLSSLTAS